MPGVDGTPLKLSTTEELLKAAVHQWSNVGALSDAQVILIDDAHKVFSTLYRIFDPSPNLRVTGETFTRLRELRGLSDRKRAR